MTRSVRALRMRLAGTEAYAAVGLAAVAVGAGVVYNPLIAVAAAAVVFGALTVDRLGRVAVATVMVASLPWLVVFGNVLPPLLKTFAAAAAAGAFFVTARPDLSRSGAGLVFKVGLVLFFAPVGLSLLRNGGGAQLTEAAKYIVFPTMAFALVGMTRSGDCTVIRTWGFRSAVAALTAQLMIGLAGLGGVSAFYHSGERLGFASAHDIALLAVAVAGGAAVARLPFRHMLVVLGVATLVTLQTGVRSALVGLIALALLAAWFARGYRVRWLAAIAAVVVFAFATGATDVIANRLAHSRQTGEFATFATAGSGRGEIWTAALRYYAGSPAPDIVAGTGLRTTTRIEDAAIGEALVGHSDVVQVLVELGLVGIGGLLLMWGAVIRRTTDPIVFVPIIAFALLNGTLEYTAPLVVGLALSIPRGPREPEMANERDLAAATATEVA